LGLLGFIWLCLALLGFIWSYSSESGHFNGLRRIQIEKFRRPARRGFDPANGKDIALDSDFGKEMQET
jgi:hypothetical protein